MTTNGEIVGRHKAVELSTGEVILMPLWKLKRLGYNTEPDVPVLVVVDVMRVPGWVVTAISRAGRIA